MASIFSKTIQTIQSVSSPLAKRIISLWSSPKVKIGLLITTLAAVGLGTGLALVLRSRPFQRQQLEGAEERRISELSAGIPTLARPVHVLILGTVVLSSDRPSLVQSDVPYFGQIENNFDGQSDGIIFLRLDPQHQTITALSIPRDTLVDIPDLGMGKINRANFVGGLVLSARTVSQLLGGVQIDRYVRVNGSGFAKLIDALGGVEVYVPKDMKYRDDSQRLYIDLKAGKQLLNGAKALQYMRFRQDDLGDIGRIQRQQAFIRALIDQKLNLETVVKLPEIFEILRDNIDTNLSVEEMLAMGKFAAKVERKDARLLMLPGRFGGEELGLSYWLVNEPALAKIMAEQFQQKMAIPAATTLDIRAIRIVVQESANTKNSDRLKSALAQLRQQGYIYITGETNPQFPIPQKTLIIAQNGDWRSAQAVQKALGRGEIVIEATGALESDVTVRLGRDWQ